VPEVPLHVASTYLGLHVGEDSARTTRRMSIQSVSSTSKPTLEMEAVTHACEPCGALFDWLRNILVEYVERAKVTKELITVEADLNAAMRRQLSLECDAAEIEAAQSRARVRLAERDSKRGLLQPEVEDKKGAKDPGALDVTVKGSPTPFSKQVVRPNSQNGPPPPPSVKMVEVEISGTLAVVEQEFARLQVPFDPGTVAVLNGDPQQALVLPRIASLLKEHHGRLKILIEGHRLDNESDGVDVDRCLSVYGWLVEVAGCAPGLMRVKAQGATYGMGNCAIPVPIQEVIVESGPVSPMLSGSFAKPGLHFEESTASLTEEAMAILPGIAKCLIEESLNVRIEGHIDKSEPEDIAMQRAQKVRDALRGLGVKKSQLRPESCKNLHPLSRLQPCPNRRVELHIV